MRAAFSVSPRLTTAADLTEPIDIYSQWIDAAEAAQNGERPRRPVASSSRPVAAESDDE